MEELDKKREEIREGLGRDIGFGIAKDIPIDLIVETVLGTLDSQDVVIKVNKDLPPQVLRCANKTMLELAGYVAVESLIKDNK